MLEKDGQPKKDKNGMLIGAAGGLATGAFGKMLIGKAKKKALKQAGRFDRFIMLLGTKPGYWRSKISQALLRWCPY